MCGIGQRLLLESGRLRPRVCAAGRDIKEPGAERCVLYIKLYSSVCKGIYIVYKGAQRCVLCIEVCVYVLAIFIIFSYIVPIHRYFLFNSPIALVGEKENPRVKMSNIEVLMGL